MSCVASSPTVVRINGIQTKYTTKPKVFIEQIMEPKKFLIKPLNKITKLVSISLYTVSGALLSTTHAYASPTIWKEMAPIFGVFQDIAMVIGALAVMSGLIVMIFKKKLGWMVINTAIVVVLGCFLVPSAVMLVAIVGKMLNGAFAHALETLNG